MTVSGPLQTTDEPLPRRLTMWGVWLLVVNGLIGAGIFGVPGEVARLTGPYSPLVFVLCSIVILPILLCFAELASYFRTTGGPIRYAGAAFGPFVGFETGWTFYVGRVVAFAANLNLLLDSASYFAGGINQGMTRVAVLFALCAAVTWINVAGSVHAMRSLAALTALKFLPLIALIVFGLGAVSGDTLPLASAPPPAAGDVGAAALLLIYAYVGFEGAVVPAGETRQPARDIPRALILGLVVVTALYVLLQTVAFAALPTLAQSQSPLLDVAAALMGPAGAVLLMAGVLASVAGNLVGSIFSTPRMTYALARDGHLPAWFAAVHPRFETPANSVVFYGVLAFLLAAFGSFVWLAVMGVLVRLLMYMVSIAALPILRQRFRDAPDRFVLPGGYAIPAVAVLFCLALLTQVGLDSWIVTAAFVLLGLALYAAAQRDRVDASSGSDSS